jgi:hypothetical protein
VALTNTPHKRKLIEMQRETLKLESVKQKQRRSSDETFDEDESRRNNDENFMKSINDHYTNNMFKEKSKSEVIESIFF